jgi:thymidylate synthase
MNKVDKQYLDLAREILENGSYKETRSGGVYSLFGKQMRFDLKEGFPILTTKKVFTKGVIHELLWFLNGDTNIKYLVDNNVHIWDDDAYRHYLDKVKEHNNLVLERDSLKDGETYYDYIYEHFDEKHTDLLEEIDYFGNSLKEIVPLSKEEFLNCILNEEYISLLRKYNGEYSIIDGKYFIIDDYRYGDLGLVYGAQWRKQGRKQIDQIKNIIEMLKTNPDDRRMICMAWNSNDFDEMALPPCHYGFQVYTRELTPSERLEWLWEHSNGEYDEWKSPTKSSLDDLGVPTRELSLMWQQRSVDTFLGLGFNITSYSLLLCMLAQCVNMAVGEVTCSLGDCHIYEAHFDAVKEQLIRDPFKYKLPKLVLNKEVNDIDKFTFDDIKIEEYESYPTIKAPLCVGL